MATRAGSSRTPFLSSAKGEERWSGPGAPVTAALAFAASLAAGMLAAAFAWIPLLGMAGAAVLAWFAVTTTYLALSALLIVRSVADYFAEVPIVLELNAGAILGIAVVIIAGMRLLRTPQPRGLIAAAAFVLAFLFWFILGLGEYGAHPSLLRELVRSLALVAVALIALNHGGTLSPSRLGTLVVLGSLIPASVAVVEGVANWHELATDDYRARGSLAHANSAGLLFAIAILFAAWKWTSDRAGRRYLVALLLFTVALLFTKSMGGLGQAVIGLMVFGMLQGSRWNRWAILAVVVGFVVFFFTDPLGITRSEELATTNVRATEEAEHTNTLDWRLVNAAYFLRSWQEAPVLGHGFGTTVELIWPFGYEPHSDYLRALVETGIVGTVLLLAGFAWLLNALVVRWRYAPAGEASFYPAMLALFVGLAAHAFVTHATFETAPMFLIAVLIGGTLSFQPVERPALIAPWRRLRPHRSSGRPAAP